MSSVLRRCGAKVLDWLLPQSCLGCSAYVSGELGFCSDCEAQLERRSLEPEPTEPAPPWLLAPYEYAGPLKQAIHRLKYNERAEYARRLVDCSFSLRVPSECRGTTLIPVPVHQARLLERGYNQAGLIAGALAKRWHLPVDYDHLRRLQLTTRQVGLSRREREHNVQGAFVANNSKLKGLRVVLVDDVVTTGATSRSCQDALTSAGAEVVGVIALARAGHEGNEGNEAPDAGGRAPRVLGFDV